MQPGEQCGPVSASARPPGNLEKWNDEDEAKRLDQAGNRDEQARRERRARLEQAECDDEGPCFLPIHKVMPVPS